MRAAPRRQGVARARALAWLAALASLLAVACSPSSPPSAGSGPAAGPVTKVSSGCSTAPFGDAEVEAASDPRRGYAYDLWIDCLKIGFARSANGGQTWSRAVALPTPPSVAGAWDPAIVVGPSGAVYAAFMVRVGASFYPVVDISTDHGATFEVSKVGTPRPGDFGDRDFVAVGPPGEIYVTWDYAPDGRAVRTRCYAGGSCAYTAGDFNVVVQRSIDGGRTWSEPVPVAPGFPASGSISAPVLVLPSGQIDVLFERFGVSGHAALTLGPGQNYFTSSADGGRTWSAPVPLGPPGRTLSLRTWWIDGSLGADAAGNLYAAWDTQSGGGDVGWLSYSTSGGRSWSAPVAVTSAPAGAVNIVQVLGGAAGRAYVGLLTDGPGHYAQYLRAFAIGRGWTTAPVQVSRLPGISTDWPGDTIGLALDGGTPGHRRVVVSWGSAVAGSGGRSAIWAAVVSGLP